MDSIISGLEVIISLVEKSFSLGVKKLVDWDWLYVLKIIEVFSFFIEVVSIKGLLVGILIWIASIFEVLARVSET